MLVFFLQGVTFPAMHSVIAKWAPPLERTQMTVLSYSGRHRLLLVNVFSCIYGQSFGFYRKKWLTTICRCTLQEQGVHILPQLRYKNASAL